VHGVAQWREIFRAPQRGDREDNKVARILVGLRLFPTQTWPQYLKRIISAVLSEK
jgi:hypothetical protein